MPVRPLEPTLSPVVRRRPEILAPAGDDASLAAALAAGADAVYFGLDEGLNARARAANFSVARLPELTARIHAAGAKAYLTLNTLIFEHELPVVEGFVRAAAEAGVDALIVQDPAVALLARAIAPTLEVHASTQMTISSPEGARFAERLGVTRIVVPRELSVDEIGRFAEGTSVPLEVFVHGALCMSWSGQCLTSEAWGGRSANRGQCAQSCRLPYDLVVDGVQRPLGDVRYLLSPLDLAGVDAVAELAEIGVASLKIEGRLKGPAYVHTTVRAYAQALDGRADSDERARMGLTYSRGFSEGFLRGADHQHLVQGRFPKHRGVLLGRVAEVGRGRVRVVMEGTLPPEPGMGVGFDLGRPEESEPGGPLYAVEATQDGFWLGFGPIDLSVVRAGHRVWLSGDGRLEREAQRASARPPEGRIAVTLHVAGAEGEPLRVTATSDQGPPVSASGPVLERSHIRALDTALLLEKLGAMGGTSLRVEHLVVDALAPGLFAPPSALKELRRTLVAACERAWVRRGHAVDPRPAAERVVAEARALAPRRDWEPPTTAVIVPLCRTDEQLDAVIAAGLTEVELDWMERVGLIHAVRRARDAGLRVTLATTRVQKPGEEGYDDHLRRLAPEAVLVRHWGGLETFAGLPDGQRPVVHGDFSLNVTNSVTAQHLLAIGCDTVTAAHDLDEAQLLAMLAGLPAERVTVVVHHHVPTFHTEHCVVAHTLSQGADYRSCGRPCEQHRVALRDRDGLDHPVVVDVGCRNTVFDARASCAPTSALRLVAAGVRRLRVEFVWESGEEAATVLAAWSDLLAGRASPSEVSRRVAAHEQFGVTRGTLRVFA
ncbi:MAG: U32 family peptidase [Myxococcales bacterium]|nr:U32 family peptidase [Myxococcales bacterium]